MENCDYLQDWVFHYNIFSKNWSAIPRELYQQYWSYNDIEGIVRSKELDVLLDLLHKTKGDIDKIKEL
jgi:hypothetical protein